MEELTMLVNGGSEMLLSSHGLSDGSLVLVLVMQSVKLLLVLWSNLLNSLPSNLREDLVLVF